MMMGKDEEVLCGCGCRLRAISRKQTLKHFSERKKFSDRARVKFSCKGIAFAIVAFSYCASYTFRDGSERFILGRMGEQL
jgi:hypothetical protein